MNNLQIAVTFERMMAKVLLVLHPDGLDTPVEHEAVHQSTQMAQIPMY